jgi:hypothetical protein
MKEQVIDMLRAEMTARKEKAILSLKLLTTNPVGIGDHSTGDFYDNCIESLVSLSEADDALETLKRYKNEL